MLKFSIYLSVWILTVLLLTDYVGRIKKYATTETIDYIPHYYSNSCHHRYWAQQKKSTYFLLKFIQPLQYFTSISAADIYVHRLLPTAELIELSNSRNNSTAVTTNLKKSANSVQNKLKYNSVNELQAISSNSIPNVTNYYYANETRRAEGKLISISNDLLFNSAKKRGCAEYLWKRRTLCAISEDKKYSPEVSLENSNKRITWSEEKTLLDCDAPNLANDIENSDSLKTLVRVKRSKPDTTQSSSLAFQQDYLKDLTNSFPQNTYDLADEHFYDSDVSWDTKREINSEEFFGNDEQSVGQVDKNIIQNDPLNVPSFSNNDEAVGNNIMNAETCSLSRQVTHTPPASSNAILFPDKSVQFEDNVPSSKMISSRIPLKNIFSLGNPRSRDTNQETLNSPEDPMLAVELVRKKRNDRAKIRSKKKSNEKDLSSESEKNVDSTLVKNINKDLVDANSKDKKRSIEVVNPSTAIANFKARLLRLKRKAKNNHRDRKKKSKKKKKHVGKKHNTRSNDSSRSKNVRPKSAVRSSAFRKGRNSEAQNEGKSKLGIANLVSKKYNDDNFRPRSVKSKKSIERTDSENDYLFKRVANSDEINENKGGANDKNELLTANFVVRGEDSENTLGLDASLPRERTGNLVPSVGDTKLRAKRDENTETKHGFLNEEDELRYYENIREPELDTVQCVDRNKKPVLDGDTVEGNRAVRSIEEVRELAQKLVTKVNELQNYLNIDEANRSVKGREKRTEPRAIDDLCSNVSTASVVFKEAPTIVKKCVPSSNHEFASTARIVERKAKSVKDDARHKYVKRGKEHAAEKKRGVMKVSSSRLKRVHEEGATPSLKWGRWTDWSSCSVTCGKGRQIRWRYCLRDCNTAETEMEEKACQLPACPPGKFLGFF